MPQPISHITAFKRAKAKIENDGGMDRRKTFADLVRDEKDADQRLRDQKKGRHNPSRAPSGKEGLR